MSAGRRPRRQLIALVLAAITLATLGRGVALAAPTLPPAPLCTLCILNPAGATPQLVSTGTTGFVTTAGPVLAEITGSTGLYPVQDALGSVRTLTSSSQAVAGTTSYDVFGAVTAQSGTQSPLGFTGQQSTASGLVYDNARSLDPTTGQFTQADTVQPNAPGTQGFNLYAYAGNNPTTVTDPTGHDIVEFALNLKNSASEFVSATQARIGFAIASRYALLECVVGNALNIGQLAYAQANGANYDPVALAVFAAGGIPDCGTILAARGTGAGAGGAPEEPQPPQPVGSVPPGGSGAGGAADAAAGDITISDSAAGHIFRDSSGHLVDDTAANRSLLTDTANNAANKVGTDQWGNDWYAETQSDGTQVWVRVRNGQVTNGGVNATPWNNFGPGGMQP